MERGVWIPTTEVSRDIAEWLARLGLDEESKQVEPEPSLRMLFWQRRYDEIIERMSNVDLDEQNPDDLGYLAFAFQATGHDLEAIPVLNKHGASRFGTDVEYGASRTCTISRSCSAR